MHQQTSIRIAPQSLNTPIQQTTSLSQNQYQPPKKTQKIYQSPSSHLTTHYTQENRLYTNTIGSSHSYQSPEAPSKLKQVAYSARSLEQQDTIQAANQVNLKVKVNTTSLDFTPNQQQYKSGSIQSKIYQDQDLQHTRYQSNQTQQTYASPQNLTHSLLQHSRNQVSVEQYQPHYLSIDSHPQVKPYDHHYEEGIQENDKTVEKDVPAKQLQEDEDSEVYQEKKKQPQYIENVNEHYFQLPQPLQHPERNVNECKMQQPNQGEGQVSPQNKNEDRLVLGKVEKEENIQQGHNKRYSNENNNENFQNLKTEQNPMISIDSLQVKYEHNDNKEQEPIQIEDQEAIQQQLQIEQQEQYQKVQEEQEEQEQQLQIEQENQDQISQEQEQQAVQKQEQEEEEEEQYLQEQEQQLLEENSGPQLQQLGEYQPKRLQIQILTPKGQIPKKIIITNPPNPEREQFYENMWESQQQHLHSLAEQRRQSLDNLRYQQEQILSVEI